MKKAKSELNDWMRPSYKRSDFKKIERGKYAARLRKSTNIVVLDPEVAKVFPNNEAVNNALRGLIEVFMPCVQILRKFDPKRRRSR
jgi:hypothetical protein